MDLLEYQAKELFRDMGIPVLPSQRIDRPSDLKRLKIPYPVVLKSQVYIGGRARLGGVRFVSNTIDAIAAAQTIFNLPIMGEYPKVVLAEAKYNADREFYLAVVLNRSIRRPVLLGCPQGGVDVQAAIDQMQHVVVDEEFAPFHARRLALKMGLQGPLVNSVSTIIEKMYRLFREKDLDLVEINPLGVTTDGEVMALDGKITVNDEALARHTDLTALDARGRSDATFSIDVVSSGDPDGNIGVLCNGSGLMMATSDLVCQAGGKPASLVNIGSETHYSWHPQTLCDRLEQGLELLTQNKQVKVVLVNIICNTIASEEIAQVLVRYFQRWNRHVRNVSETREEVLISRVTQAPHLVVRLVSSQLDEAKRRLTSTQAMLTGSLDEAVQTAVTLTK